MAAYSCSECKLNFLVRDSLHTCFQILANVTTTPQGLQAVSTTKQAICRQPPLLLSRHLKIFLFSLQKTQIALGLHGPFHCTLVPTSQHAVRAFALGLHPMDPFCLRTRKKQTAHLFICTPSPPTHRWRDNTALLVTREGRNKVSVTLQKPVPLTLPRPSNTTGNSRKKGCDTRTRTLTHNTSFMQHSLPV